MHGRGHEHEHVHETANIHAGMTCACMTMETCTKTAPTHVRERGRAQRSSHGYNEPLPCKQPRVQSSVMLANFSCLLQRHSSVRSGCVQTEGGFRCPVNHDIGTSCMSRHEHITWSCESSWKGRSLASPMLSPAWACRLSGSLQHSIASCFS